MAIQQLASEMHSSKLEKLAKQSSDFRDRVLALLESIRVQWTEDTEEAEAERIRGLLHPFLEPKKRELAARQGKFHEFLETSVPQQIDLLVGKASREAEGAMRRDLRRLQDANWSTLKAVIVRGGAFYGKRPVDLPRDMASRFEEHVAPIWSTSVIGEVRKRTAQLADDYVSLVGKTVAWAASEVVVRGTHLKTHRRCAVGFRKASAADSQIAPKGDCRICRTSRILKIFAYPSTRSG